MRLILPALLALLLLTPAAWSDPPVKQAPKVTLKSPDGKTSYDLEKLTEKGPVLVRLTCACVGCDKEVAYFQKLQNAYNTKGLQTLAVFREKAEATESYVGKKDLNFMWLSDPSGALWKTFDAKAMPTNILIDKGGKVVRIVPGCTVDGKNANILSQEIARILGVEAVQIAPAQVSPPKK